MPLFTPFFISLGVHIEHLVHRALHLVARPLCLSSFFFDHHSRGEQRRGGGSLALVPRADTFKPETGYPAVQRHDALGRPLTRREAERLAALRGDRYQVVYLPSWYKVRIGVAMYALWLLSTIAMTAGPAYCSACEPCALCCARAHCGTVLFGRTALLVMGVHAPIHDTYAFLVGLFWTLFFGFAGRAVPYALGHVGRAVEHLASPDRLVAALRGPAQTFRLYAQAGVLVAVVLPLLASAFVGA